jgi:hypothetical protein
VQQFSQQEYTALALISVFIVPRAAAARVPRLMPSPSVPSFTAMLTPKHKNINIMMFYYISKGADMKKCILIFFLFILVSLLPCCVTSKISKSTISNLDVDTDIKTRQILNLRVCDMITASEKTYGEKVMKNGFLDTRTEEYGYYSIYLDWNMEKNYYLYWLSMFTLSIFQLVGVPYEVDTYYLSAYVDIFDSNGILIRNFKGTGTFKQAVGYYYGRDNSEKANEEYLKIFTKLQISINEQSEYINRKLNDSGPINYGNSEEASKNMLVYLSSQYKRILSSPGIMQPRSTSNNVIANSYKALSANIPDNSRIALVNINSENQAEGSRLLQELTVLFVDAKKYIIVDRADLAELEKEQNFQMSGYVSDDSIVSIGHFLGADIVITGSISGENGSRRLILKALDVKTAQIIAASSELM